MIAEVFFWICAGLILFTYIGYPLLLMILNLFVQRKALPETTNWPDISVLISARNAGEAIEAKIANVLANGYPADRIEVIVYSDGSTDDTNQRVREFGDPRVQLVFSEENIGKNALMERAVQAARHEILVLTDYSELFEPNAIQNAVRHFVNPKIGLVSGRIIYGDPLKSNIGAGYVAYWLIENGVRILESNLGYIAVTVGTFEVIRRDAYFPVSSHLNNDMFAPMYARSRGYVCRFEPQAVLTTEQRRNSSQELARRIRMAIRGFSTLGIMWKQIPFFRNPGTWCVTLCHKYLRWMTWLFMIGILVANVFLVWTPLYLFLLAAQLLGYGMAFVGWGLSLCNRRIRIFTMPFYFCLLQVAAFIALFRTIRGHRIGAWKPTE